MGWAALAVLGAAAMATLVALRLPRALWSFAGAALMLGATGYALQGRPGLPARVAVAAKAGAVEDPALVELRDTLFGRYSQDHAYQVAADALSRSGDDRSAAIALLGGLNRIPRSVALWTGLGGAIASRDGQVSPAARLAFDRALRLAPEHPGPPFFLGLSLVRADDYAAALPWWRRALQLCPPDAPYRRAIAERVVLLERAAAAPGARPSE